VRAVAAEVLTGPRALTVIGPDDGSAFDEEVA